MYACSNAFFLVLSRQCPINRRTSGTGIPKHSHKNRINFARKPIAVSFFCSVILKNENIYSAIDFFANKKKKTPNFQCLL